MNEAQFDVVSTFYPHLFNALKSGDLLKVKAIAIDSDSKIKPNTSSMLRAYIIPPSTDFSLARVIQTCIYNIEKDEQALCAIALELYYHRHQKYPDKLEELVPEILPNIPMDRINSVPLHYAKTEAGRYKIWSMGYDGVDDGGKIDWVGDKSFMEFRKFEYKGDWTWKYEK